MIFGLPSAEWQECARAIAPISRAKSYQIAGRNILVDQQVDWNLLFHQSIHSRVHSHRPGSWLAPLGPSVGSSTNRRGSTQGPWDRLLPGCMHIIPCALSIRLDPPPSPNKLQRPPHNRCPSQSNTRCSAEGSQWTKRSWSSRRSPRALLPLRSSSHLVGRLVGGWAAWTGEETNKG